MKAFEFKGYTVCQDGSFEVLHETIAIFAKNGIPKHASLLLDESFWTSKLGKGEDIRHRLHDIEGNYYGRVVCYLKRAKKNLEFAARLRSAPGGALQRRVKRIIPEKIRLHTKPEEPAQADRNLDACVVNS